MKSYGVFWGIIGVAFGVYAMQETKAPEAFGIDPASLWTQYSPLILGALLAIVNNGDWPDWVKKLVGIWAKDKGADITKGEKVIAIWQKAVELLREIQADPKSSDATVKSAMMLVEAANLRVIEGEPK